MDSNKRNALIGLIACNTIWALDYVLMEYLTAVFPPQFVNYARAIVGAAILWTLCAVREKGLRIERKDWPLVLLCGAFGCTLYGTMESFSIKLVGSAMCSLILATVPIMGMIADRVLYKKAITGRKVAAILISVGGVALLVLGGTHSTIHASAFGIFLMFLTAACWVAYILLLKPVNEKYNTVTSLSGMYIAGLITGLPVAATGIPTPDQLKLVPIAVLIISGAICITVGNFLYIYAVKNLSVTTVSAFENVLPVVTCIGAYFAFGEMLGAWQIVGGLIIMAATTWVSMQEGQED